MRLARAWAVLGIAVLVLALAIPVRAQNVYEIEIKGVIVSVDPAGRGFVLARSRRGDARRWFVRITEQTQIQIADNDDDDDEDEIHLAVGDLVSVKGQALGARRLLAKQVTIEARGAGQPIVSPPVPVHPPIAAPQLFTPANRETINTADILIVGRTVPGSNVHIDVSVDAFFRPGPTSADTQADANGVFVAKVNPPGRFSGANIRITVTSNAGGVTSAPTTVVVRQL